MTTLTFPIIDVAGALSAALAGKKKRYQQHTNRVSALDDPCLRRLYYSRHDWDKATDIDDRLAGVFETGTILESVIQRIVLEVGIAATPQWRIVGSQTPTNDNLLKKYQISGTIDGFLQVRAGDFWQTLGVIDIKTASPNIFPTINDYADLARYSWTRKYRGQLMLYALAHNQEQCNILFVNKSNLYDMKLISFPLDMAYCESLLAKAEKVNDAIASDTPPAGVNNPDECPGCSFFSFCHPDISTGGNLEIIDNAELEAVLDRLADLKDSEKEIAELEKVRDALLVKGRDIACGRWLVTWNKSEIHKKAAEAQVIESWRKLIRKNI